MKLQTDGLMVRGERLLLSFGQMANPHANRRIAILKRRLATREQFFVTQAANRLTSGTVPHSEQEVHRRIAHGLVTPGMVNTDYSALASVVMMEAAQSAQKDLASIMDAVKLINKKKAALRDQIARLETTARATNSPVLKAEIVRLKNQLDAMNEMGEMENLRLQMAMDRLSKMMTALSSIMKKMSDTSTSIVQNLK